LDQLRRKMDEVVAHANIGSIDSDVKPSSLTLANF
jgi:hypothetical protein